MPDDPLRLYCPPDRADDLAAWLSRGGIAEWAVGLSRESLKTLLAPSGDERPWNAWGQRPRRVFTDAAQVTVRVAEPLRRFRAHWHYPRRYQKELSAAVQKRIDYWMLHFVDLHHPLRVWWEVEDCATGPDMVVLLVEREEVPLLDFLTRTARVS